MTTAVERAGEDAHAPDAARAGGCGVRAAWHVALPRSRAGSSPSASARSARSVIAELGVLQLDAVHACVPRHRERRPRRRHRRGRRGEVPRPPRHDHRDRAGRHRAGRRRRARRVASARRRDHPGTRARRRVHERAADVLGGRDRAAVRRSARRWPRTRAPPPSCGPGSAASPRRTPTRGDATRCRPSSSSTRRRRTRCSRRRTPSCTARSGTSTRPPASCSAPPRPPTAPACRRTDGCTRWLRSSRTTCSRCRGARELHRAPAVRIGAERVADLTGIDVTASDVVDLYSCFPSAVRIQARELGLPLDDPDGRPLSVGGGMTFGGGPLNNATFQALARMVPMLRDAPGTTGLLTFISGIITKHGTSVWSTTPARAGASRSPTSQRRRRREHARARSRRRPPRHRGRRRLHRRARRRRASLRDGRRAHGRRRTRVVVRNDDAEPRGRHGRPTSGVGREIVVDGDRFQSVAVNDVRSERRRPTVDRRSCDRCSRARSCSSARRRS